MLVHLVSLFESDSALAADRLVARLLVAFVLGCAIAGLYRATHGRIAPQSRSLMATLVLLTVLIAMMTLVIGDNMARAFSLVGALAIVRFRTVVADTRDTAFVIFAVAVGMALGAGFVIVPLAALPVAGLAAFLFAPQRSSSIDGPREFEVAIVSAAGTISSVTHAEQRLGEAVREALESHAETIRLLEMGTAKQGSLLESEHRVRLRRGVAATSLLAALRGIEGVQDVELKVCEG